jgi:hypothetical protein
MNHPDIIITTTTSVVAVVTSATTADTSTIGSSCEICGWMAAICSALAFGTFAVPIKSDVARSVNIDPLVFQSYKTIMCFATAWFILLVPNHHTFTFTPWGIVSGLFWVPRYVLWYWASPFEMGTRMYFYCFSFSHNSTSYKILVATDMHHKQWYRNNICGENNRLGLGHWYR